MANKNSRGNNITPKLKKQKTTNLSDYIKEDGRSSENWTDKDTFHIYQNSKIFASNKIAAFDLDGTLITTKSGKVFPTDENDWCLWGSKPEATKAKLAEAHHRGFHIVIFSNQRGILKKGITLDKFKGKIESVTKSLLGSIPCSVLFATGDDYYRKPLPGMWKYLEQNCHTNDGDKISRSESFYVGDAAGRDNEHYKGKKKDFSCSDRLFAINLGLGRFYTPEEYFYGVAPEPYHLPPFDPRKFIDQTSNRDLLTPRDAQIIADSKEIIIMVGFPASGKSFFAQHYLVEQCAHRNNNGVLDDNHTHNDDESARPERQANENKHSNGHVVKSNHRYIRINMDTLKTRVKCERACRDVYSNRGLHGDTKVVSAIVDNTNPDRASRKVYLDIARQYNIRARCFHMTTTFDQSIHNEKYRRLSSRQKHSSVPPPVFHMYKTKFEEPGIEEGFAEIIKVSFMPSFDNEELKQLYSLYL